MIPFKLWSDANADAKSFLWPDLKLVAWGDLADDDKKKIWLYLTNKGWFARDALTIETIDILNETTKRHSFARRYLDHGGPHTDEKWGGNGMAKFYRACCLDIALDDFEDIFRRKEDDVVLQLLSFYVHLLQDRPSYHKSFADFKKDFNDISFQFGLKVKMADEGFIPRQDERITETIWTPTLKLLAPKKWEPVNRDLRDALIEYQKGTPEGYSGCITHVASALQAFLQITIEGKTGKGDISALFAEAIKRDLIANDSTSIEMAKAVVSALMKERQHSGDAHPKKVYANEQSALLALNLTFVLLQHWMNS